MLGSGKNKNNTKKKKSRFSFLEKYSLVLGFLLFAGLLVSGYLPDHNPIPYLVLGPIFIRILVDIGIRQTIGSHIFRNLHPKILFIDTVVVGGGLFVLYSLGYWGLEDISLFIEILNVVLEQLDAEITLPEEPVNGAEE